MPKRIASDVSRLDLEDEVPDTQNESTILCETLLLLEEGLRTQNDYLLKVMQGNGDNSDEEGVAWDAMVSDMQTSLKLAQSWASHATSRSGTASSLLEESRVRWKTLEAHLEELASDLKNIDDVGEVALGNAVDCCMQSDENAAPEMTGYVEKVRRAAQSARPNGTISSEKYVILPTSGKHENTFIFLHGFKMEAKEMLEVFVDLSKELTSWRFVLPQAPSIPITAHEGVESFAWFDYLTDHGGVQEDTVDIFGVRRMKVELQRLMAAENALLPINTLVVLGGLSQGGTMALHMAAHSEIKAVVTAVACRLSHSMARPLKCPWHALIASEDDVFPSSWSQVLMEGASTVQTVDDSHYLEKTDITPAFLSILSKLQKNEARRAS